MRGRGKSAEADPKLRTRAPKTDACPVKWCEGAPNQRAVRNNCIAQGSLTGRGSYELATTIAECRLSLGNVHRRSEQVAERLPKVGAVLGDVR